MAMAVQRATVAQMHLRYTESERLVSNLSTTNAKLTAEAEKLKKEGFVHRTEIEDLKGRVRVLDGNEATITTLRTSFKDANGEFSRISGSGVVERAEKQQVAAQTAFSTVYKTYNETLKERVISTHGELDQFADARSLYSRIVDDNASNGQVIQLNKNMDLLLAEKRRAAIEEAEFNSKLAAAKEAADLEEALIAKHKKELEQREQENVKRKTALSEISTQFSENKKDRTAINDTIEVLYQRSLGVEVQTRWVEIEKAKSDIEKTNEKISQAIQKKSLVDLDESVNKVNGYLTNASEAERKAVEIIQRVTIIKEKNELNDRITKVATGFMASYKAISESFKHAKLTIEFNLENDKVENELRSAQKVSTTDNLQNAKNAADIAVKEMKRIYALKKSDGIAPCIWDPNADISELMSKAEESYDKIVHLWHKANGFKGFSGVSGSSSVVVGAEKI